MELRPYQKEAKEAIFEQWDSGVLKPCWSFLQAVERLWYLPR